MSSGGASESGALRAAPTQKKGGAASRGFLELQPRGNGFASLVLGRLYRPPGELGESFVGRPSEAGVRIGASSPRGFHSVIQSGVDLVGPRGLVLYSQPVRLCALDGAGHLVLLGAALEVSHAVDHATQLGHASILTPRERPRPRNRAWARKHTTCV